ncbi:MAG TPA: hypothetical protein VGY58_22395 [Gemmataceae bacterium]|nr:hypothetical protein [Gemmataceae bacterium]
MRKSVAFYGFTALLLSLCFGCGSDAPPEESKPQASKLGDTIDISLAELLTKPRSELADMADEWSRKIQIQQEAHRTGTLHQSLLPDVRLPLVVPVWRECKYSARTGLSLPPYLPEGSKDSQLALHVARYGDVEAARKLIEPGDSDTLNKIEACALGQNYPLEWTRLAGLLLHAAEVRLATGDVDGGTEIVVLHRQLKTVLGAKAATAPLGAALLSRGWETLQRAQRAWQENNKTELAAQAQTILADWGEVAPPPLALDRSQDRSQWKRALQSPGDGPCLPAGNLGRALDTLELPFTNEALESVIACLDEAGRLGELFLTYRAGLSESFLTPGNFAHVLEECRVAGREMPKEPGLLGRSYQLDGWTCEVTLVSHGAGAGALVHLGTGKQLPPGKALARDFGPVDLDHGFEQTRLTIGPEQRQDTLLVRKDTALAQMPNPIPSLKPSGLLVDRVKDRDLVARFVVEYNLGDQGCPPLAEIALPVCSRFGAPRIQGTADDHGGHLSLLWEDARTRYVLALPYEPGQPVRFEVVDQQPAERVAEREAAAQTRERDERKARIQAGKPLLLVARQLEQVELGMSRAQVSDLLPTGQAVLKQELPGLIMVTFTGDPDREKSVLRQLFVRFDKNDYVAEIRARYVDGPEAGSGDWTADLLKRFKKNAGAPTEALSTWATLWSDLGGRKSAARFYEWQDDVTRLTYQFDAGGAEVCLSGRPLDHDAGAAWPVFAYLPRGANGCLLEMKKEDLLKGSASAVAAANGAFLINPGAQSPYDALLVWFEKDRAVRIVGRHAQESAKGSNKVPPTRAVSDAWSREVRTLGWPRRQDFGGNDVLQSLGWHDECTRTRIFWQENDDGSIRVFTEWKDLAK